ncbi:SusC/RagA family TonB-linked outer membrane protein [Sphingobacterium deserti]|uniref:TonB-dependent receptor n=1 Tax=Sphingobacterium deserti TaxID=1229276 RepID=A0A0B8T6B3_9SPHI|nr:SusC/RagA family TonB-linked outer membrane protein [Sphingobacterium deserti]KGE13524.1 TonB-dependent receptor [Sphingobacterium deserti]
MVRCSLWIIVWLGLCLPLGVQAQTSLTLIVRDSATQETVADYSFTVNGRWLKPENGRYNLAAFKKPYHLRVTHIGYAPYARSFDTLPAQLLVLLLKGENVLDEVEVNTGYQSISRERLTGSVEVVGKEVLERSPSSNILNRLEDMTTAVAFDRRTYNYNFPHSTDENISVRGISTIESAQAPLIILDNFPYEGSIENINPNDVESISILKDAAASSIWGARAGNGVIVVTTKKGSVREVPRISLSSNFSVEAKPDLFRLQQTGSSEFIDMEMYLFQQGFYNAQINNLRRPVLSPVVELLRLNRDGLLPEDAMRAQIDRYRDIDIRQDYMDYFYRNSVDRRYALNISGGTERSGYYLSAGFDQQDHTLRYNGTERITLNSSYNISLGKRVDVQSKIMFSRLRNERSNFGYDPMQPIYPYAQLLENGEALAVNHGYSARYLDGLEGRGLLDWRYRPYDELRGSENWTLANDLLINLGATVKILPGLSFSTSGQLGYNNGKGNQLSDLDSYLARNLINRYTSGTQGSYRYGVPMGGILAQTFSDSRSLSLRNQLDYQKRFAKKHNISMLVGAEVRESTQTGNGNRLFGYNPKNLTFIPVDLLSNFPTYENVGGSVSIGTTGFYTQSFTNRFVSLYGNMAYTYADRYDLYLSARRDASNIFGVETNNKWTPLWSIGGAWSLHKESFFNNELFSTLKLRISYGHSGNVNNTVPALSTVQYGAAVSGYGRLRFATLVNPPNPSLRWENVQTTNLGLDFALLKSRLKGSIDLYQKKSVDLIGSTPMDPTTGITQMNMNSADLMGRGMDFTLTSQNLQGALQWSSTLMLSYNKVMVTRYMVERNPVMSAIQNVAPIEGYPAYAVFSYPWGGLNPETGNPIGFLNGEASEDYRNIINNSTIDDLILHGNARPLWFGSLRNDLRYKNISLSMNIGFRFQYFFRRAGLEQGGLGTWRPIHADWSTRWQASGDEQYTNVPSFIYPTNSFRDNFYNGAEVNVQRGDVLRLNDVRVAYRWGKSRFFQNIECFALVSNVGILWRANDIGIDPATPRNEIGLPRTVSIGFTMGL